jgi:hypothetical protein
MGGYSIPPVIKGGAICTRGALAAAAAMRERRSPVDNGCFLNILTELCTPGNRKYDAFTLLNLINYHLNTTIFNGQLAGINPLLQYRFGDGNELELSNDGVIGPPGPEGAVNILQNRALNRILVIPRDGTSVEITYVSVVNSTINVKIPNIVANAEALGRTRAEKNAAAGPVRPLVAGRNYNIVGAGGILSEIAVLDNTIKAFFRFIYSRNIQNIAHLENNVAPGAGMNIDGGGLDFYQTWNQVQTTYSSDTAKKVFTDFLQLLSICENQYFLNRDSADNFYVYNPLPVLHGGHTQYQMMAFFDTLIKEYHSRKSQPSKLDTLLKCFVYFPFLLKRAGLESILVDLSAYISLWFEFEMVMDNDIEPDENVNKLFASILNNTSKKLENLQSRLTNSDEECADYLYTIFPHGYFVIKYNEIKPIQNTNKKITNAISIKTNSDIKNTTNMNIITKMQRLSIKNKSLRLGRASINTRSQTVGGKRLTKKRRNHKRKTHKKRKY